MARNANQHPFATETSLLFQFVIFFTSIFSAVMKIEFELTSTQSSGLRKGYPVGGTI